jgi:branched-subunit amino acid aminotransferase/4-amino-4-deoxychorismate lyase
LNSSKVWVWRDGQIRTADAPLWSGLDRGPLYGDGLFETLGIAGGEACDLELHLARFVRSAGELGYPHPDELATTARRAATELMAHVSSETGVLRITWTRGPGERGFAPDPAARPTVTAHHFELPPDLEGRRQGVRAIVATGITAGSLARHKSCSSLAYVEAARRAREAGVEEALLEDGQGGVSEASAANLFAVIDNLLVTPPLSLPVLPGITRAWVLEEAISLLADESANGHVGGTSLLTIKEHPISLKALTGAQEIFLTSSVAGVLPLVQLGGEPVGQGSAGPLTREFQTRLDAQRAPRRDSWTPSGGSA